MRFSLLLGLYLTQWLLVLVGWYRFLSFSAPREFYIGGSGGIARSVGMIDSRVHSFGDPLLGGEIRSPVQI